MQLTHLCFCCFFFLHVSFSGSNLGAGISHHNVETQGCYLQRKPDSPSCQFQWHPRKFLCLFLFWGFANLGSGLETRVFSARGLMGWIVHRQQQKWPLAIFGILSYVWHFSVFTYDLLHTDSAYFDSIIWHKICKYFFVKFPQTHFKNVLRSRFNHQIPLEKSERKCIL